MRLAVLILEDEAPVRDAVERDLAPFAATVRIDAAEDVADAWDVVAEVEEDGDLLALILADHRLPGRTGVDFLVEADSDERTIGVRKVLVTGQADQDDTIRAVNQAGLHHYIAKPWEPAELQKVVRAQLTDFVIDAGLDPLPHLPALEGDRAMELLR